MFRIAAALFCVLAATAARAAPVGKQPNDFGQNGIVTDEQLAKLTYSAFKKDLGLAVHLPVMSARAGEPLWAYFVVANSGAKRRTLDMGMDYVLGPVAAINSCGIDVVPLQKNVTIRHDIGCGFKTDQSIDVDANGYFASALDVSKAYDLAPGDYEISWKYRTMESNKVRFRILPNAKAPKNRLATDRDDRGWRTWTAWHVTDASEFDPDDDGSRDGKLVWQPAQLQPWHRGDLSAALGGGLGKRHVTNLELLSAEDDRLRVTAEWHLGNTTDRVVLRLESRDPKVAVDVENLSVYLLMDRDRPHLQDLPDRAQKQDQASNVRSIEVHLPSYWRMKAEKQRGEDRDEAKTMRAAFLVMAKPLRGPSRNRTVSEMTRRKASPADWDGLLRTELKEVPRMEYRQIAIPESKYVQRQTRASKMVEAICLAKGDEREQLLQTLLKEPEESRGAVLNVRDAKAAPADVVALCVFLLKHDPSGNIRSAAASHLYYDEVRDAAPLARQPLLDALKDSSAKVRLFACQSLMFIGDQSCAKGVRPLLADPDKSVRMTAVRTLGWIGDATDIPAILKFDDPASKEPGLDWYVGGALARLGEQKTSLACLLRCQQRELSGDREAALRELKFNKSDQVLPAVIEAMEPELRRVVKLNVAYRDEALIALCTLAEDRSGEKFGVDVIRWLEWHAKKPLAADAPVRELARAYRELKKPRPTPPAADED